MPPPNCLSCGGPPLSQRTGEFKSVQRGGGVGGGVRNFLSLFTLPESFRFPFLRPAKEAAAPRASAGPMMYDCHLPH